MTNLLDQMKDLIAAYQESSVIPEPEKIKEIYEPITNEQAEEILYLCRDYPEMLQDCLDKLRLEGLEYMPKKEYRVHIERMRKIIEIRKKAL